MSNQVDQVEITPVARTPEPKRPEGITGIIGKIRKLFDDQMAPSAQPQVIEVTDEAEWQLLEVLDEPEWQVLKVTDKPEWNEDTALEALKKLSEPLSVELFFELAEKSSWDIGSIYKALQRLDKVLSIEQVVKIAKQSGRNTSVLYAALEKLENSFSSDKFFEIAEKLDWDYSVVRTAMKKLDGTLLFEQVLKIILKSKKSYYIVNAAFGKLDGELSFNEFFEMAEQTNWSNHVVCEALKVISGTLSFEQVLAIAEKSERDGSIIHYALKKLEGIFSIHQFFQIADQSNWDDDVVSEALKMLTGTLSFDQILEIANKAEHKRVAYYAFQKFEGTLSIHQFFQIAEISEWNYNILIEALGKINEPLSIEHALKLVENIGGENNIIREALKKLEGTFLIDQFFQITKLSKWNDSVVRSALKKLRGTLSFSHFYEICDKSEWDDYVFCDALKKLDDVLSSESVLKIFKARSIYIDLASKIISKLRADNLDTSVDYTELIFELTHAYPNVLLDNLEKFRVNDTIQIAVTLLKNGNYGLVIDHLSHFPQKDWAEIIKLLMKEHRLEKHQLTPLLSYIDFVDEQTKNDLLAQLLQSPNPSFYSELLENETPRAIGQFGSFRKAEQRTKLTQLKEGRFYKALLALNKAYGYSAEQIGFTFEDILSEIKILVTNNNDKHLFDLISLALHLFPEKEIELQNIRETFSSENSSPTEEMKPRESFTQFDALKEIFEYYAMLTLSGRYTIDLLPHSLTSRITDKINTLYEKIKEYIVIAVSSELRHSRGFKSRMFGNHGNFLYKFGTPEDIRVFFERARIDFSKESNYPGDSYGGPSWATIADFGAQFWTDSAQTDLNTKITLLNLAVSLQHNNGYFFDKDSRVSLENRELRKLLDFEAGGEQTFESFLAYGLENYILSQEEYAEFVQLNNTLSSATEQLPTRVDSNQIYLRQMVQEAKKQIEAIQNNPTIPFEIKMEAQAVFSKTEGFSRKENYRLYLSNLLKTISINWENIDDTIKRFQSGNQVIYSVSIAGYDLAYWYEDGKLITIHSMDELKQQRQKLSQLLNQPIVAAQFGYVREGD